MEIQLGDAIAKPPDHTHDIILAEMTALMKSEQSVGRSEPALAHYPARPPRQGAEDSRLDELAGRVVASKSQRRHHTLAREAKTGNFVLDGKVDQNVGEQWMNMKIQMTVDMVEIAHQFEMPFDLCAKFGGHFGAHRSIEEVTHSGQHGIPDELPGRPDRAAKLRRVEHAPAPADGRMQADIERRI